VRKLPRLVIVLGIVSLLTDLSSEMILPLLPALLLGTLGATPMIVGLVDGIADAVSAILKLVAGHLSDRASARKPFVLAGYTLSTIVRPLAYAAMAPWHVIAVRAVDRVGKGVRSAPRDALLADAVPAEDAPRAYAFHRMMDHTGAVLGPLVAAALLAVGLSAREAIAFAWVPGALAVVALFFFVPEVPRAPELIAAARATQGPTVALSGPLVRFLVIVGVFSLGVLSDAFILVRARDLHMSDALLPVVWSVLHVAKVAAAALVGRANVSSPWVLAGAWLVIAVGVVLLTVDAVAAVWVAAVVVGIGHGAREPIEKSIVRARAPDAARGRAFGAYHLVTGLGALPAGLAIGWLWVRTDGLGAGRLALFASAGVVAMAALSLVVLAPWACVRRPPEPR
jgi:MFS-type transporter involved in bile tolerance (Atg22 family)